MSRKGKGSYSKVGNVFAARVEATRCAGAGMSHQRVG